MKKPTIKYIDPIESGFDFYDEKGNGYNYEDVDGERFSEMKSITTVKKMTMEQLKVYLKERQPDFTEEELQKIKIK
jgi:hypothetical protein